MMLMAGPVAARWLSQFHMEFIDLTGWSEQLIKWNTDDLIHHRVTIWNQVDLPP